MATQALYRKWRSKTFAEVIGQQHVTQTLQNAIEADRVGHAYLFTGPRGTGKTSTARLLAKAVNCTGSDESPCNACSICRAVNEGRLIDLIEIDAASNTSVDDIRDLRDKVDFRPGEAQIKFYIIDEVHMLSKSAFNALLKTLEEPPPHVAFVLATTEPEKIPATITSRCQRFDFRRIKVEDVVARLSYIVEQEGLKAEIEALTLIARQGSGSMRDSISLLDQLTSYGEETLTLDLVRSVLGTADQTATAALVNHTLVGQVKEGLELINHILQDGVEPRQFTLDVLEYLRGLLLVKYDNGAQFLGLPEEVLEVMRPQSDIVSAPKLLNIIERFNEAVKEFKLGAGDVTIPQLPLELALVEAALSVAEQPASVTAPQPTVIPQPTAVPQPSVVPPPTVTPPPSVSPSASPAPPGPSLETTPPPLDSQTGPLSLSMVQAQWGAVGADLKRRNLGMAQGLLNSGQLVEAKNNIIIVSFPGDLLRRRVDKFKSSILESLESVLGMAVGIEFVVGQAGPQTDPPPASHPPAEPEQRVAGPAKKKETMKMTP